MFECLAALKVDMKSDFPSTKGFVDLKEESEAEEADDHYDDNNDEVFSLELERGEEGLGLALVDIRVSKRVLELCGHLLDLTRVPSFFESGSS